MRVTALPTLVCPAPAKVNLTLMVGTKRPDGFHELESWVTPIGLADRVELRLSDAWSLRVEGAGDAVPADDRNLVWRAARALADAAGRPCAASIRLFKRIPAGSGLGGGSSDAAATLAGLNRLWELRWPVARLADLAAVIGSDVPLFLAGGPVVMCGRGDIVQPGVAGFSGWMAIVVPPYSCATGEVYAAFARGGAPATRRRDTPWLDGPAPAAALMPRLFNQLEPAAFTVQPRLGELHARLDGLSGRVVRMTGSGSALFTLFDRREEAEAWRAAALGSVETGTEVLVVEVPGPAERDGTSDLEGGWTHGD